MALNDLTHMANEVGRVIFSRAKSAGRLHVEQVSAMYETQRQAAAEIDYVLTRRKGRQRLLLLDMDGTVTPSRFVVELAQATGHEPEFAQRLDQHEGDAVTRSAHIGKLFQFVHKKKFEQTGTLKELRRRKHFTKPSIERRSEVLKAQYRELYVAKNEL